MPQSPIPRSSSATLTCKTMQNTGMKIKRYAAALKRRIMRRLTRRTAAGLVDHARECLKLKTAYLWGGLGFLLTDRVIDEKIAQYPEIFDVATISRLRACAASGDIYGFDCSGLIKRYMMGGLKYYDYDASLDMNANRLLEKAEVKGDISSLPEVPGLCLYMETHVGIYVGEGGVIESTPNPAFGFGVCETHLSDREWQMWFTCPAVKYPMI